MATKSTVKVVISRQKASDSAEISVSAATNLTKTPDVPQQAAASSTAREPSRSEPAGVSAWDMADLDVVDVVTTDPVARPAVPSIRRSAD